jgi:3-dehydroquinate dehydratase/shikimate dehydrogenase
MANDGKICIPVCAKTADRLIEKIDAAAALADVVEIRFDCLEPTEVNTVLEKLPRIDKQYLITYRPKEQGGARDLSIGTRLSFWSSTLHKIRSTDFLVDCEFDLEFPPGLDSTRVIVSMHDFSPVAQTLLADFESVWEMAGKTTKIAVSTNSVTDGIPVWQLLHAARGNKKNVIPIAMGEAGKWTRILGLAHGATMTYASLETGSETAPGQISAADMNDIFRVKELDLATEVYGVLASNTSYSISPWMHNAAFKAAGMNRVFVPLQTTDVGEFVQRMVRAKTREVELNFGGFSVTNPHKRSIIQHLDNLDGTAAAIGAVNTVKVDGGELVGYNTDAAGFLAPLKTAFGDLRGARVAVIGAGGASRAVIYSLTRENADVTVYARDVRKVTSLADQFSVPVEKLEANLSFSADILVNTTPLGTKGENEDASAATADQLRDVKFVYDLVYNPAQTKLLRAAATVGVPAIGGLEMLIEQGAEQFRIWTGEETAPLDAMTAAVQQKLGI